MGVRDFISSPSFGASAQPYYVPKNDLYENLPQFRDGFEKFLSHFGIVDFGTLSPDQALMFVAAKNSVPHIAELEIPEAKLTGVGELVWKRRKTTHLVPGEADPDDSEDQLSASSSQNICLADGLEDYQELLPSERLLEEVDEDLFLLQLAEGNLFKPCPEDSYAANQGLIQVEREEFVAVPAAARDSNQHAYALVDCSETMGSPDKRGLVARGMTLAFLLAASIRNDAVYCATFRYKVDNLVGGYSFADFKACVQLLLETPNKGGTSVQGALSQMATEFPELNETGRIDIALFTDGISPLDECPLSGDQHLHTFLLESKYQSSDPELYDEFIANRNILYSWSTTKGTLHTNQYQSLLIPSAEDREWMERFLNEFQERLGKALREQEIKNLFQAAKNIRHILKETIRVGKGKLEADEMTSAESLLKTAHEIVKSEKSINAKSLAKRNSEKLSPEQLRRLHQEEQAGGFDAGLKLNGGTVGSGGKGRMPGIGFGGKMSNPLKPIIRFARWAWDKARSFFD